MKECFIFDVVSHKEIKRIPIGQGGAGMLVDTDGSRVFVACPPDNYVAEINLKTLELTNKITIAKPDGLAWAVIK